MDGGHPTEPSYDAQGRLLRDDHHAYGDLLRFAIEVVLDTAWIGDPSFGSYTTQWSVRHIGRFLSWRYRQSVACCVVSPTSTVVISSVQIPATGSGRALWLPVHVSMG